MALAVPERASERRDFCPFRLPFLVRPRKSPASASSCPNPSPVFPFTPVRPLLTTGFIRYCVLASYLLYWLYARRQYTVCPARLASRLLLPLPFPSPFSSHCLFSLVFDCASCVLILLQSSNIFSACGELLVQPPVLRYIGFEPTVAAFSLAISRLSCLTGLETLCKPLSCRL